MVIVVVSWVCGAGAGDCAASASFAGALVSAAMAVVSSTGVAAVLVLLDPGLVVTSDWPG